MKFRKDINGLRAVAVIAVVLFHFNEDWLPGGFAGVDVFFVISGFLMTSVVVSKSWYEERNRYFITHFNNANFPSNAHSLNVKDVFCNEKDCFAVRNNIPLYFDNDHPSLLAAKKLVALIELE